jgi:hypothetical protein
MTTMLLKFSKKVVWISQQRLAESHVEESTVRIPLKMTSDSGRT